MRGGHIPHHLLAHFLGNSLSSTNLAGWRKKGWTLLAWDCCLCIGTVALLHADYSGQELL